MWVKVGWGKTTVGGEKKGILKKEKQKPVSQVKARKVCINFS